MKQTAAGVAGKKMIEEEASAKRRFSKRLRG